MPLGGKLVLKGGETLKEVKGVEKKKIKKKKKAVEAAEGKEGEQEQQVAATSAEAKAKSVNPSAGNVQSGKTYEEEFEFETKRANEGKTRSAAWGSSYRAPPEILHGYSHKVTGKTAEERLDLRAAKKADKYCK